jgi:thiamine biosynthesis lipoprotein
MEYVEFRAMNSDILLAAEGATDQLAEGFRAARAFVDANEARLTRFSEGSELAALNRSGGTWFRASEELYDVVRQARAYSDQTNGLFDPSILNALEFAGYDKSMDEIRAHGVSSRRRTAPRARADLSAMQFDDAARAIWLPPAMRLDLGGIAKGWIAERAARLLSKYADACVVDAGGDMFMLGLPAGECAWRIALEDPRDEKATLAVLCIAPGAVATSSITKRRWQQDGYARHHLIDPRRGEPAETDWLSVTVIAPHATTAEVFAKSLLIAGSREAERIAARRNDIVFIAVDGGGRLWGSRDAKELMDVGFAYV